MPVNFENTQIAFQYRSNAELRQAAFLFSSMGSPLLTKIGTGLTRFAMGAGLPIKGIIRKTIFRQFCGGESMEDAAHTAAVIGRFGVRVILDYSVEGKEGEAEFDHAVTEFVRAIRYAAGQKQNIPFISIKVTGFARFALLEKWHSGAALDAAEQAERSRIETRVDAICKVAAETGIMVLIDAEESWIQQAVDDLADAMMARYNNGGAVVYNTFQMYRHDRLAFLQRSADLAARGNYILGAKLVRGAYMEKERARAAERGYPSPIQPDKQAADADYDHAVQYGLDRHESIALFIGTHNEASCAAAVARMDALGIPHNSPRVWFSQLYGMSDNISFNLADAGYNVAKYLPYGPVSDVIPYLLRRAQENTSVAGQTGRELSLIRREMKRRGL